MKTYILRRFLISLPLLLGMSFVTFLFIQMAPGSFFDMLKLQPEISLETIAKYEALYHLDKPIIIQYLYWLKSLLRFDLGYSFFYNSPVTKVILPRAINTLLLSFASLIFSWIVAIPLGIYAAVRRNRLGDRIFSVLALIGISMPSFFFAFLLLYLASLIGVLPIGGMFSVNFDTLALGGKILDVARHMIIPVMVISLSSIAGLQRLMRGNLLEVLRKQYILTAKAKGLSESRVIYVHALRNAINPLITIFGYQLSGILSGAALTEIICNWPGLGQVMLTAVRSRDLYLVMAGMLLGGIMLILGNLIADILLAIFDPRIRYD